MPRDIPTSCPYLDKILKITAKKSLSEKDVEELKRLVEAVRTINQDLRHCLMDK